MTTPKQKKRRGKRVSMLVLAVLLVGCAPEIQHDYDQCLRNKIFMDCLAAVPKGPTSTGSDSDWDEIVSECASVATWQCRRAVSQIRPECLP